MADPRLDFGAISREARRMAQHAVTAWTIAYVELAEAAEKLERMDRKTCAGEPEGGS